MDNDDTNNAPPPAAPAADPLAGLTPEQIRAVDSRVAAARREAQGKSGRREQAPAASPTPTLAPREIATRTAAYLSAGYDPDTAADLAIGNFALPPPPARQAAPQAPPPPRGVSIPPPAATADREFGSVFRELGEDAARDTWQAYVRRTGANPANPYDPRNRAAWREMRKQFETGLSTANVQLGARRGR